MDRHLFDGCRRRRGPAPYRLQIGLHLSLAVAHGKWLAFRRVVDSPGFDWALAPLARNSEIFVSRIDGGAPRNLSNGPGFDGWPSWSSDSRWIVFASNRDRDPRGGRLYAVRPDGSDLRTLSGGDWSRTQPSFAPDGSTILVYESHESADREQGHVGRIAVLLPAE